MVVARLFNADGSPQADLSRRLPKYLGSYYISGAQQSGTITHPEFNPGRPFILCLQWPSGPDNSPVVTLYADRIEWSYPQQVGTYVPAPVGFDYGVY